MQGSVTKIILRRKVNKTKKKSSGYKITIFIWKLEAFTADIKHHVKKRIGNSWTDRQTDPCGNDLYLILATFVLYKQF